MTDDAAETQGTLDAEATEGEATEGEATEGEASLLEDVVLATAYDGARNLVMRSEVQE